MPSHEQMSEHDPDILRHFARIRAAILGYLRILVRDAHLAEDLFQDTCVVVLQKMGRFDRSKNFEAWVRGIARNLALNALRKGKRVKLMTSPELVQAIDRSHALTPEGDGYQCENGEGESSGGHGEVAQLVTVSELAREASRESSLRLPRAILSS